MNIKEELRKALIDAKFEPEDGEDERVLLVNLVFFVIGSNSITVCHDIDSYPDDASKISIFIWEFCKKFKIDFEISEPYFYKENDVLFGREAYVHSQAEKFTKALEIYKTDIELENYKIEEMYSC